MSVKIRKIGAGLRRMINLMITLLLVLAIICAGFGLLNKQEGGKGYPSVFGVSFFEVLTDSMHPTFSAQALVWTKQVPADQLKENDIISFRVGEEQNVVLTHRIAGFQDQAGETQFLTKGDANRNNDDGVVVPSQIIGKVIFWIPRGGWYLAWLKQPAVIVGLLLLILLQGTLAAYIQRQCPAEKSDRFVPTNSKGAPITK